MRKREKESEMEQGKKEEKKRNIIQSQKCMLKIEKLY